ncbi:MAG: hypothetical protein DMG76_19180 [Acidobacteria bacterium]|nr:MAG: hypothetical protein DMG76_19180 [Acidobacteriota bacterium]
MADDSLPGVVSLGCKTDWGISITTARVFGKIILRQFGGSVRLPSGTTRQPRTILDTRYLNGRGVSKDRALAAKWYATAAEQDYAPAQNNLGQLYQHGLGVRRDYAVSVQWYREAAQQGLASAKNNLGAMYEAGLGVPKNYVEAVNLYRAAAEQGEPLGESNLAFMYLAAKVLTETSGKRLSGT